MGWLPKQPQGKQRTFESSHCAPDSPRRISADEAKPARVWVEVTGGLLMTPTGVRSRSGHKHSGCSRPQCNQFPLWASTCPLYVEGMGTECLQWGPARYVRTCLRIWLIYRPGQTAVW